MDLVTYQSGLNLKIVDWTIMGNKYKPAHPTKAAPLMEWRGHDGDLLSAHFRLSEFKCHDENYYGYVRVAPALIELLEKIRKEVGGAVSVISGYRPPAYNAAIPGAAKNSYHIDGIAADIVTRIISYEKFYAICNRINPHGGVGKYWNLGFVHVDVRGFLSRW